MSKIDALSKYVVGRLSNSGKSVSQGGKRYDPNPYNYGGYGYGRNDYYRNAQYRQQEPPTNYYYNQRYGYYNPPSSYQGGYYDRNDYSPYGQSRPYGYYPYDQNPPYPQNPRYEYPPQNPPYGYFPQRYSQPYGQPYNGYSMEARKEVHVSGEATTVDDETNVNSSADTAVKTGEVKTVGDETNGNSSVDTAGKTVYSLTDVNEHASETDCWVIIDKIVLNLTDYVQMYFII
jgi:hypothetical protein